MAGCLSCASNTAKKAVTSVGRKRKSNPSYPKGKKGRLNRKQLREKRSFLARLGAQPSESARPEFPGLPPPTLQEFPPLRSDSGNVQLPVAPKGVWGQRSRDKVSASRPDAKGVTGASAEEITRHSVVGPHGKEAKKHANRVHFLEEVTLAAFAAAGLPRARAEEHPIWADAQRGDAQAMKKRSGAHRAAWILGSGSRLDAQLSFIGRALPPAPRESVQAALAQHKEDLSSSFSTNHEVLSGCRDFVRKWAKQMVIKPHAPLGEPAWPSTSSCRERSAGKGGALRHLLLNHAYDDLPDSVPTDQMGAVAALELRFVLSSLGEMEANPIPSHRVTCLSERGLKTRVVTVGPAWCQVLGHAVRKRLLKGLRVTPGTHQPLVGAKDEEMFGRFLGGFSETLVSTDLTRATDLLPLDLVSSVVDGLELSGKFTPLELRVLRTLTGPQSLDYEDETILSSRGVLMGLPTSWCILSLIHLYWLDEVKNTSKRRDRPHHKSSICGDDALLATTSLGARTYRNIVAACGGAPSVGKHYECSAGYTRRGVFLEKLLEFSVVGKYLGGGMRFPAIPVKGLTSRNLPRNFTEGDLVSCRSFGIRQVLVIDALASDSAALHVPLRDYISIRVSWLARYSTAVLGLSTGHPLRLGGFLFAKRTLMGDAQARLVRDSGRSFSMEVRRELDPNWRMASQFSMEGRNLAKEEGELVDLPAYALGARPPEPPDPEGWRVCSEEERVMATTVGMFAQISAFSERKNEVFALRASDFVKRLAKLRLLGSTQPSGFDLSVTLGPSLIAWRLPHVGDVERGTSWLADLDNNRRLIYQAGLATL